MVTQKYRWVAIGEILYRPVRELQRTAEHQRHCVQNTEAYVDVSGIIESISPVVLEGTTHYYICIK